MTGILPTLVLLTAPAFADDIQVGQPAPDFSLPDLNGELTTLSQHKGKTVVLEWFNPGCPFVKYAHDEGPLSTMAASHTGDSKVVWLAINSSAEGKQGHGVEANKTAASDWKMSHPILLDASGEVGHKYGAKTTPQMFIIDESGMVAYAGALDNAPFGKVEGTINDFVGAALSEMNAGKPVSTDHTKPYGCSVKY
jgi:hypothetical protein